MALVRGCDAIFVSKESKERDAAESAELLNRHPDNMSELALNGQLDRAMESPAEGLGQAAIAGVIGVGLVVWGVAKTQADAGRNS
jgi:hypothetical protein